MNKSNFQIVFIVIFLAAAVFGIFVFSGAIPIGGNDPATEGQGTVVLWGTVPAQYIAPLINSFNEVNQTFRVEYFEKSAETFNDDLLEALASGGGPDMFFLPDDLIHSYANKIFTIPYASYPIASFKNDFAGAGEVFLTEGGILALPLSIDPLVLYYNRSMLDANNIIYPPQYWDELVNMTPTLTKRNDSNQITKSAVALGQFSNIKNAKDVLSMLFMQYGNPIVMQKDGIFVSLLGEFVGGGDLGEALGFYTDFSDPLKGVYSWNKSFSNSTDAFSAENLAFYFGHASELGSLINRNPNQNFLVSPVPQIRSSNFKLTSARVTGIAISAFSQNANTAFIAASRMATGDFAALYADSLSLAPARRDLLARSAAGSYGPTFYQSALYARSWLDPSPSDTDDIFRLMVEKVLSNNMTPSDAIKDAGAKLGLLLFK